MENEFFSKPILNSPYEYPSRQWDLDEKGQPTQKIIDQRRQAEFITPIPKPKKRKDAGEQKQLFDVEESDAISTHDQRYDPTPIINKLRKSVDDWRKFPDPSSWLVTPETARLLQHWRHHSFNGYYQSREIVPNDMLGDIERAKIVITNYHAFKLRKRLEISKGGRLLLQGRGGDALSTLETEGQMLQRVMPELMGMKNIMALNDEAHHCYREILS